MSDLEELLVDKLVSRLASELPYYKQTKRFQKASLSEQNEEAIVDVSGSKTDIVITKLLAEMDKLSVLPPSSEQDNTVRILKSQLRLLTLIQRCLEHPWTHIKSQYNSLKASDLNNDDLIRLKEKVEKALPPPIGQEISKKLYKVLQGFLVSKSIPFLQTELQDMAAKCLFQISASNFDDMVAQIFPVLNAAGSEEEVLSHIVLLEHLNVNEYNMGRLLEKISSIVSGTKKSSIQIAYAKAIRIIIWNWIYSYPLEFVNLCKSKSISHSKAEELFNTYDGLAGSSTTKRINFWPVCTMLMILCPEIMKKVVLQKDSSSVLANKRKFFENLQKGLSSSKLSEVTTLCYVDICKASTYINKSTESALRFLFTNTENELISRLFNAQAAAKSEGQFNEQLMTDFLLSSFYLSHRKIISSLFVECIQPNSPQLFKRVLVNALYRIASEVSLPWNPTIADVYSAHSVNLRQLFRDLLPSLKEYNNLKNATDKKSKASFEKAAGDLAILTKLIDLYAIDPVLALFSKANEDANKIKLLLTGLCTCVGTFELPYLSKKAGKTLLTLHQPENVKRWCPETGIDGFWSISSAVNIELGTLIRDNTNVSLPDVEYIVETICSILEYRIQFFEQTAHIEPSSKTLSERFLASTTLESSLLIFLGSKSSEIVSKCISGFSSLCKEIEMLRHCLREADSSIISNYEAYKQLADTGNHFTGRQAQQKVIRTCMKQVQIQTAGNVVAWDELYVRWRKTTETVLANEEAASGAVRVDAKKKKGTPVVVYDAKAAAETLAEWDNGLGILCSLVAVLLNQTSTKSDAKKIQLCSTDPDEFLTKLMEFLTSDYVSIREKVKRVLGSALNTEIYPSFFRLLHAQAQEKLFTSSSSDQANFTPETIIFVENAISCIKLLLEAEHEEGDLSAVTNFEDMLLVLLKFVRQTTLNENSLLIRHKLCGLLEAVMANSSELSFKNENMFRTDLIANIMEWTSEFSTKEENLPSDDRNLKKVVRDLDAQVMKSISALLHGLPLHGKDDETKSKLFSKFFNFFTRLLTRCKKAPQTVLTPQLPEATIQSISYLVTANIEHGLEYFVTMGYHRDHETRSAFLRVLTNILKERSDFDSGEITDKYYKLQELVMDPELEVILTLCDITPITEADIVAQLLIRFFEANEKTLDLLKAAVMQEVKKTESANTLFRRNSMATKLLAQYCKLIGRDYLRIALAPTLKQIMANPPTSELDPSKLHENEDLHVNQKHVLDMSQQFLSDIEASIPYCPASFRIICQFLQQVVSEKFPGSEHTAIAGFMFLRYLCPAIVAPDGYGVIDSAISDKNFRRCLVLVTKVLQNLANRVQFTKEPFMHCMNPFIEEKLPLIRNMFDTYAIVSEDDPLPPPISFSDEQKAQDIGRIHYYLSMSKDKIVKEWSTLQESPLVRLQTILTQLGPPPELPTSTKNVQVRQAAMGKQNIQFDKFMNRMAGKDTSEIKAKEIYYQHGKTALGEPVFYYIANRFTPGNEDLLIYYILSLTRNYLTKPYSIVVDLTMFGPQHQFPSSALSNFYKIIPTVASENLKAVYFLNMNQWFKKYSKPMAKYVARVTKKFVFCSDLQHLYSFIPEKQCNLPEDTSSLATTVQSTFSPVTRITQNNKKEVKLIVCTDYVQVVSLKPQMVYSHPAIVNDILHVSALADILKGNLNSITLRYQMGDGQRSIELLSDSKDQITQQLTASRDRYKLSQPQHSLEVSKAFRPSDVPGTLLNMALMNLTVSNHALRGAAYNLLCALCNTFAFKINSLLLEANAAIPKNSKLFTVKVSTELAKMEPNMTLEFLQQSLDGMSNADKVSQILVLDYVKPWLWNFGSFYLGENQVNEEEMESKIIEIFGKLIDYSVNAGVIRPAVLSKVWSTLGKCQRILDYVIDQVLAAYFVPNLNNNRSDSLDDIISTVASVSPSLVSGKIITKLLDKIASSSAPPESGTLPPTRIEDHPCWKELDVLIRWCAILSFDNLLCVDKYLPEILHIILMCFFSGDSLIRSSTYALFINTIHSLFSSKVCHPEKLQRLRVIFNQFQELPTRLQFGLGGSGQYQPFKPQSERDPIGKTSVSLANVENVATCLYQVLNCCCADVNSIGTPQHSRWLSLISRTAFSPNTLLQPRAIIALGVLAQSSTLITDSLVQNLIQSLRNALSETKGEISAIPLAIINCLSRNFSHIHPDSTYYSSFFWIGMSLCQIQDKTLFTHCVPFLNQVVQVMSGHGSFRKEGMAAFLKKARKGPSEQMLAKLDQLSALSFKYDFSFAMAGHLLKGLKTGSTKAAVTRLLNTLVSHSDEKNPANVTGYLAALLPHCGDNMSDACSHRLLACSDTGSSLFNPKMVPDKIRGSLLFTMLASILKSSESQEHEQLYVYRAMDEGAQFMPDCFPVTFDVLMKKIDLVIANSQNEEMITAVMNLMNSVYKWGLESTSAITTLNRQYLGTIGFAALGTADQFEAEQKDASILVVCRILDGVLTL